LDLAENELTSLDVSRCKKLIEFSCRDNFLTELDLTSNINLGALYISNNFFPPTDVNKLSHLKNLQRLIIGIHIPNDIKIGFDDRCHRLANYYKYNAWYGSLESFKDSKLTMIKISDTDIDKGLEYLPESLSLSMLLADSILPNRGANLISKKIKEKLGDESENNQNQKSVPSTKFEIPSNKDKIYDLTITGR